MDPMSSFPRPPAHAAGPPQRTMDRFERGPGDRFDRFERGPGDRFDRFERGPGDRFDRFERGPGDRSERFDRSPADRALERREVDRSATRHDRGEGARGTERGERPAFGAALEEARAALETPTEGDQELIEVVEETLSSLEVDADAETLHAVGWPLTLLAAAQRAQGEEVDAEGLIGALEEADGGELLGELEDVDAAALLGELEDVDAAALLGELEDADAAALLGELDDAEIAALLGQLEDGDVEGLVAAAEERLAELAAAAGLVDGEQASEEQATDAEQAAPSGDGATHAAEEEATAGADGADGADDADATAGGVDADEAAAAATAASASDTEAARVGPPRSERAEARAAAQPQPPGLQGRTEGLPGAEVRGGEPVGQVQQTMEPPRGEPPRMPQLSAGVQRVLELVAQLEKMPPPRQLVLDLGDLRLRVGMEDGQVKLTVMEGDERAGDELLSDARDALAEQGFDLASEGDGDPQGDDQPQGEVPRTRSSEDPLPARRRPVDTGLRL